MIQTSAQPQGTERGQAPTIATAELSCLRSQENVGVLTSSLVIDLSEELVFNIRVMDDETNLGSKCCAAALAQI